MAEPTALLDKQPLSLTYHNGELLSGPSALPSPTSSPPLCASNDRKQLHSASSCWATAEKYYTQSNLAPPRLTLSDQILDEGGSLGKSLKSANITAILQAENCRSFRLPASNFTDGAL
ncbi:hypothetical protein AXF42_Ash017566 [Apostasia shenzhenica]|uniref:Uncharacterized protein n=1 Tax=Apostasia shenzhenica TaxID=1088818 RepID=A0A2I0A3A3_9ASPA|nr:hypothetical protein AXF42_Ash017566 [Apostasia shenzhenica]